MTEICEAAEKQAGIEAKLGDVRRRWAVTEFTFVRTARDVPVLSGHATVMEELEESQVRAGGSGKCRLWDVNWVVLGCMV